MSESNTIVKKVWNYCDILRDDGLSYGDYLEQITYLLFLKMEDELIKPPFNYPSKLPPNLNWSTLKKLDGDKLDLIYRQILRDLGKEKGIIGIIFGKSQNKIQDPAKLKKIINLIDGETWMGLDIDIKGEIYEGLLEKNAEDIKSGAGQYFTPRALIKAIVEVIQPKPLEKICDPACGTGGFFLIAYDYLSKRYSLDIAQKKVLKEKTFNGRDIVPDVARLCVMNLFLHGIGETESPIIVGDSLIADPGDRFDIVMTNPPFGKKSSAKFITEEGIAKAEKIEYERTDFWATTSNKQLNFLQHVKTLLKINGRCAIVVPDNVLFEGGAGETVRRKLLHDFDVHTMLRLPTGIFYAQGVKANVLFFDKRPAREEPWTTKLWIYDLRTNQHFTIKTDKLKIDDLQEFIRCYHPSNRQERQETDHFKSFTYEELTKRDKCNLDIFWIKDESLEETENLPPPQEIAAEIIDNLEFALEQFQEIIEELNRDSGKAPDEKEEK